MFTFRNSKNLVVFGFILIGLYITLNILYVVTYTVTENSAKSLSVSVKKVDAKEDGTVDLVLNMKVSDLLSALGRADLEKPPPEFQNPLPTNFSFLLNNEKLCSEVPELEWIIYVHSNPSAGDKRKLLRETWGNRYLFKDNRTRIVFLTASTSDAIAQQSLKEEYDRYQDIIQADFEEGYKNLTLKGIMGLKWVSTYCKNAKYALKTDDDAFVNVFEIMKIMKKYYTGRKKTITCALWKENSMPILRDPSKCMKWCVKPHEFKGRKYFPQYCAGIAFLLSGDLVGDMYKAALTTPFFWIDDVYITGLLPPKVGNVHYVDLLRNFTLVEKKVVAEYTDKKEPVRTYLSHVRKPENFNTVWTATLDRLSKEEIMTLSNVTLEKYPFLKQKLKR